MPLGKRRVFLHVLRYFWKTKSKPAKKITGQCFLTEMEVACENSANLEQETKTTKIVTYSLFPLASSNVKSSYEKLEKTASEMKLKINFIICLHILFLNFKMYFWGFPRVLIQVNIYIHLHVGKCKEDYNIQKILKLQPGFMIIYNQSRPMVNTCIK